jgi:hypothetical protein
MVAADIGDGLEVKEKITGQCMIGSGRFITEIKERLETTRSEREKP